MHKFEVIIYDSADSALASCQEAIGLWLDTARELGRTIPEPKGRRLQLASGWRPEKRVA